MKLEKEERRAEAERKGMIEGCSEVFQLIVARRFPKAKVKAKIKRIHDVELLQQLVLELMDMTDAAALHQRLDEAIKSQTRK